MDDHLCIQIRDELDASCARSQPRRIFRVPSHLRDVNKEAYEPIAVAIGPYHRHNTHLKGMEEQKLQFLNSLLRRTGEDNAGRYIEAMRSMEERARKFYAEDLSDFQTDEFVKMMLLDSCFIVELSCSIVQPSRKAKNEGRIFESPWFTTAVFRDLLLVENQLPLFVLREFFGMTKKPKDGTITFEKLIENLLLRVMLPLQKNMLNLQALENPESIRNSGHLLELLHNVCQPTSPEIVECKSTKSSAMSQQFPEPCSMPSAMTQQFSERCSMPSAMSQPFLEPCSMPSAMSQQFSEPCSMPSAMSPEIPVLGSSMSPEIPLLESSMSPEIPLLISSMSPGIPMIESSIMSSEIPVLTSSKPSAPSPKIVKCKSTIPSAKRLKEVGIKFEKVETESNQVNLLDVKFENAVLKIPILTVVDGTECFFRNLIAYEQFFQREEFYVADYVRFMDCLINSGKDVELLCKHGIIDNWLGDEKVVADMFNKLRDNITHGGNFYRKLFDDVNKHCGRRRNKWMADLRDKYFNNPWTLISLLAAILVILLTLVQTVFAVLTYFE